MSIYEQHDKHFQNVAAYAVLHDGKPVAKIAFKFPKDGAGRLYAYVHWIGVPMVRGSASGYGYDKRSAACVAALPPMEMSTGSDREAQWALIEALRNSDHTHWDNALRAAGFEVFQTV